MPHSSVTIVFDYHFDKNFCSSTDDSCLALLRVTMTAIQLPTLFEQRLFGGHSSTRHAAVVFCRPSVSSLYDPCVDRAAVVRPFALSTAADERRLSASRAVRHLGGDEAAHAQRLQARGAPIPTRGQRVLLLARTDTVRPTRQQPRRRVGASESPIHSNSLSAGLISAVPARRLHPCTHAACARRAGPPTMTSSGRCNPRTSRLVCV